MENHLPLYDLSRGEIVESVHYGSIAISANNGDLVGWYGNPDTVTYLRSSAKPFQALPFIEGDGQKEFGLTDQEIAIICASHSGTDQHVELVESIQSKTGVAEKELNCGVHPVFDKQTAEIMRARGEEPSPNRHNCSGKHTGMLAYSHMQGWSIEDYIDLEHPVQENILTTFSEMSGIARDQIEIGIDGCSVPNFAIPLKNAALAFARLCDPSSFPPSRLMACNTIVTAMTANPFMVAGPDRFDTRLMEVAKGRIITKGGAEGYQAVGLLPNALHSDSPALGIALKVSDGDLRGRARPAITLEILRQLNALSQKELDDLSEFGPSIPILNWQKKEVGITKPSFNLSLDQNIKY
jgi:L-asparaginase II